MTTSHLLLVHAGATLAMVGVIWFVQLVHYPQMALVGGANPSAFPAYERVNVARTGWVVVPFMLAELGASLALLRYRPASLDLTQLGLGLGLLALIWASTFLLQVPLHGRLEQAWDPAAQARLVRTNWIRTLGWSARGVLALVWLAPLTRVSA